MIKDFEILLHSDPTISPQPGPSRESTSIQSSPIKRKGNSPEHRIEINDKTVDDELQLHGLDDEDDDEEDDITLQDLVALETMDDADELDMNSEPSLQNDSDTFDNSNSSQVMARKTNASAHQEIEPSKMGPNFRTQHFGSQHIGLTSKTSLQSYQNTFIHTTGKQRFIFKNIFTSYI